MNIAFDYFQKQEIPTLILCNPNRVPVASLKGCYDVKNIIRYNAISELSFTMPRQDEEGNVLSGFEKLEIKMIVYVKNMGYYIVSECNGEYNGYTPVKQVVCQSLEASMLFRRLTGFNGTFKFYDENNPDISLMTLALKYIPGWTVGYIDSDLIQNSDGVDIYRTFDIDNSTLYNFLISKVEVAFNCVFTFDTINKTVSAYYIPNLNNKNGTFFSFDNICDSITINQFSDEMCTAMYCFGDEEGVDIRSVNPLGTNVIYNFDYYKALEYMSQDLIDAINAWEDKIELLKPDYTSYSLQAANIYLELGELQSSLIEMQSILEANQLTLETLKAQKLSTTDAEADVYNQSVIVSSQNKIIAEKTNELNELQSLRNKIVYQLQFVALRIYQKFVVDLSGFYTTISNLSSSWKTIYFPGSVAPEFDLAQYEDSLYSIIATFDYSVSGISDLLSFSKEKLIENQTFSASELDEIESKLISLVTELQSLYDLLDGIIPNTSVSISIKTIITQISAYFDILRYGGNFTSEQYYILQDYIFENTYTNENIVIGESKDQNWVKNQLESLYSQSETVLGRASKPRYEIDGNFINILALPEYSEYINRLELGTISSIELYNGTVVDSALLEVEFSYDDPTEFNLKFSNRVRINNSSFQFADMFMDAAETASGVSGL